MSNSSVRGSRGTLSVTWYRNERAEDEPRSLQRSMFGSGYKIKRARSLPAAFLGLG